ncbi:MAG: hypothetical protein HC835_15550 [Oscillatoriales cyanobacterium RM2_1_1]|nr:hypothetical protein [Oscillatoriales cyanobacterium SM2_3_0]NJO46915.1 hypothetical protein [Oscillatoriales cyanobacterium RM2_1_1]
MDVTTVWQSGSNSPNTGNNLETIRQWWKASGGQEINWQQRLVPENQDLNALNWEPMKFDEVFLLTNPELRGITLYWYKPGSPQERSITPSKLELNQIQQQLYIFPQSQPGIVIRVAIPKVQYQSLELTCSEVVLGQDGMLVLRDDQQLLEIKAILSPQQRQSLKEAI